MKKIGFIGWRGMVGSVLMNRMQEEHDFKNFYSIFFSTSQAGKKAPDIKNSQDFFLEDAWNVELLISLDIIVTCQGSEYTSVMYSKLRKIGWMGYWIDSSSYLRMHRDSIIVLDPVNQLVIEQGINQGIKTFVGANCTVSLMLMALGGLFNQNLVEWVSVSTYQAASGYGAKAMRELLIQIELIANISHSLLKNTELTILDVEHEITKLSNANNVLPVDCFKIPLVGNVIPWIGNDAFNGQTQEEWKGQLETNKILNTSIDDTIFVDSFCARICALRCHSQALNLKLKKDVSLIEIEKLIKEHNIWVEVIANDFQESLAKLNPIAVSGTLRIPIGRLRRMSIGNNYFSAFTVGDQLLWGAAEPLRRILNKLL